MKKLSLLLMLLSAPQIAQAQETKNWRAEVRAQASAFRAAHPERAAQAADLQGLDPGVYRQRRRPMPEVGRELTRLNLGPLLFEMLDGKYHRALTPDERMAYEVGVVVALGRSKHPHAKHALEAVVLDDGRSIDQRSQAGYALGLAGASASLMALLKEASLPLEIRHGLYRGLGQIHSVASVDELGAALRKEKDRETRILVLKALATAASRSALRRNPDAERITMRAGTLLLELAASPVADDHPDALIEAISIVRDRGILADLRSMNSPFGQRAAARLQRSLSR